MNPLYFLLSCLFGVGLLVVLARLFLFIVEVQGQSMTPALLPGDRVLALRFWPGRRLRRGQIVVTHYPDTHQQHPPDTFSQQKYIKRITGLPGDTMTVEMPPLASAPPGDFMSDGSPPPMKTVAQDSFLRGQVGNLPYIGSELAQPRTWHVPPGHYFVQGDAWGLDSRILGPLPFGALCGVVIMKLKRRGEDARQPTPLEIPSPAEPENP